MILTIEDRVGALAEVARILAEAHVNVTGLTLGRHPDNRVLRLVVDDPKLATQVLARHGFQAHKADVVSMRIDNTPGALAKAAGMLADRGINIESVFVNILTSKGFELVIEVDDPEKARRVIGELTQRE